MKRTISILINVVLSLLLIMPIVSVFGIFPDPTADMYNSPQAFVFIESLMDSAYIMYMMAVVFALTLVCIWTKREALAALLMLPVSLNIIMFHLFLDGGLFTAGAVMGNVLFAINVYLLWQYRAVYLPLLKSR